MNGIQEPRMCEGAPIANPIIGIEKKRPRVRSGKTKESDKKYRAAHKERERELVHKRYQVNKEKIAAKSREWRINNKERAKKIRDAHQVKNREKINKQQREWRLKNADRINKKTREWYKKNIEKAREYQRDWIEKNHEKVRIQGRIRERAERAANVELAREKDRKRYRNMKPQELLKRKKAGLRWYENNKDKVSEKSLIWRKENPEKAREKGRRASKVRHSTVRGRLNHRMSVALLTILGKKKMRRTWRELVGYSIDDLMKHLEKNFLPGMTWENRDLWHVDHKIPINAFNYSCPEDIDFKKCWSLKNLQPLWKIDNIKKSNKLSGPFQPALRLAVKYKEI